MRKLRAWLLRLWGSSHPNAGSNEIDEELETHLQMHAEDNLRSGMSPERARREAILKLGGVEKTRQAYREGSGLPSVESLWQDLRYTTRQLRKNPGFAATAILVLTLGIGATVAIFAFVDAALLKPLPYREPSRLVVVFGSIPLGPKFHLSFPDYYDFQKQNKVFSSFEAYDANGFRLATPAGAQLVPGARVTAGFFRTLGVAPVLGRDFAVGEDHPSAPRAILLSHAAWQKRFGGREDILGQTVTLDGSPNTIVGVLPKDFHFAPTGPAEFWAAEHDEGPCRGCHWLFGLGRLKDGVSIQTAAADMTAIAAQLEKQYPDSNGQQGASVYTLSDVIIGDIRAIILVLQGGAALLLLIACVNVASLLLVRTQSRKREIAVRGALGASRKRLLRQFLTEGLLLAATASLTGVAAAYGAMHLLTSLIPEDILGGMPYLLGLGLNTHVLIFAVLVACVTGLLFSLTPILSVSLTALTQGLAEGSRGSAGTLWRRLGANLVVVELATAMILLVGAGLFAKSFYRLLQVDPGLQPDNLATVVVSAPRESYGKDTQQIALGRQVLEHISSLPGIDSASLVNKLPVGDGDSTTSFVIVGRPTKGDHEVAYRQVSPAYFHTLQARLVSGRFFAETSDTNKARVAIVNRALARKYFGGDDPVGMRINYDGAKPESEMEVVGLIDDIREGPLDTEARPAFYVPFEQAPGTFFAVVARTSVEAKSMLPAMAASLRQIDPAIATFDSGTMSQRIHDSPATYLHRASAWIVGSFAALAFFLSVVGLYGVIAYSVSQRTREIGVRMALGAQKGMVYQLILKEAAWLITTGLVAGLVGSVIAASLIRGLLFSTQAWDGLTFGGVGLVLAVSALAASYLPARRAASVNSAEALRAE